MSLVGNPRETGIGVGVFLEKIKPGLDGELGNDHGGLPSVLAVNDLEEVPTFVQVKLHKSEVIDRQKGI